MPKPPIVFSLGGSIIVPDQIDTGFLTAFKNLILSHLDNYQQFIIITGGGKTARNYQQAARDIRHVPNDDLDWLGIHSSRLNGHLMRTIFKEQADPQMLTNKRDLVARQAKILVGAGFTPGNSTDYVATLCAQAYDVKTIVNLSNITHVYNSDPATHANAKPLETISWKSFSKLVSGDWAPGANYPFDPVATKLARELSLEVVVMKGTDLKNLDAYLKGERFVGTIISA